MALTASGWRSIRRACSEWRQCEGRAAGRGQCAKNTRLLRCNYYYYLIALATVVTLHVQISFQGPTYIAAVAGAAAALHVHVHRRWGQLPSIDELRVPPLAVLQGGPHHCCMHACLMACTQTVHV